MRIEIVVSRARAAHDDLARRLEAAGHATRLVEQRDSPDETVALELLTTFERLVHGPLARDSHAPAPSKGVGFEGAPDLVVDFSGVRAAAAEPLLVLCYDGQRAPLAMTSALLARRAPVISARIGSHEFARGVPALESPGHFAQSRHRVLLRVNDVIEQAIRRFAGGFAAQPVANAASLPARGVAGAAFRLGAEDLCARIARRLNALSAGGVAWRVAWRRPGGDAVRETLAWPNADYLILPDDGARYYADPFVFVHAGRTWLFVEEFPYATHRGLISVCEIDTNGIVGSPRPVLETPFHLSYPFVFERDGQIYMLPEQRACGQLILYRATRFPDHWERDRVVLDNIAIADTNLIEREGRLWLLGSVAVDGQSDWDTLRIFHAASLDGPWIAHADNDVMIDATQARGAGHVFERQGRLFRPVQDCGTGYGAGLALCAIERLDPTAYVQVVEARLGPPPAGAIAGVHTLNEAGGVEAVDLLAQRRADGSRNIRFVNHEQPVSVKINS